MVPLNEVSLNLITEVCFTNFIEYVCVIIVIIVLIVTLQ